jgi:hypothetical protein
MALCDMASNMAAHLWPTKKCLEFVKFYIIFGPMIILTKKFKLTMHINGPLYLSLSFFLISEQN